MKKYIIMVLIAAIVFMFGIAFIQSQYVPQNNTTVVYIPTIHAYIPIMQETEPVAIFYEPEIIEAAALVPVHIERLMPLHDSINGSRVGHITPRLIMGYIRENTRWAMITVEGEERWVYLDFEIPVWELEAFFATLGPNVSVYFENLATGFSMSHNGNRAWFGSSAVKAPFALYIYQKASRGETDLDTTFAFTAADVAGGSGIIQNTQRNAQGDLVFGRRFTQHELLYLMIVPSDNIAMRMLRRNHGLVGYTAFIESIGANPNHVMTLSYSHLTANDAGIFMREAYHFYMSGCPYGAMLMGNLRANRYMFISSTHPIGSKSGWSPAVSGSGAGYHDMAVVFAPSPYVLVILSPWAYNDRYWNHRYYTFREISRFIQNFNDTWF